MHNSVGAISCPRRRDLLQIYLLLQAFLHSTNSSPSDKDIVTWADHVTGYHGAGGHMTSDHQLTLGTVGQLPSSGEVRFQRFAEKRRVNSFRRDFGKRTYDNDDFLLDATGYDVTMHSPDWLRNTLSRYEANNKIVSVKSAKEDVSGDVNEKRARKFRSDFGKRRFRSDFGKKSVSGKPTKKWSSKSADENAVTLGNSVVRYKGDFGKRSPSTRVWGRSASRTFRSDFG